MTKLRTVLAVAALVVLFAGFAQAQCTHCGFTPGYWKNHTDVWPAPYTPTTLLSAVFDFSGAPAAVQAYSGTTMLAALSLQGGPGLDGAAQILLRAATASVLNATNDPSNFGFTTADIIAAVNETLASGSRDTMLAIAANLDLWNQDCTPD